MSWFARLFGARTQPAPMKQPITFRPLLESLEDRAVPAVTFHGGALLPHVEAQGVYLGSGWNGSSTPASLDAYLAYLTKSPYMSALTSAGYNVGTGSTTAGKIDATALTSGSTITDASIQARIAADIKSGLLAAPDANRLYVVFVQPNVAVNLGGGQGTTTQGILGYHGAFGSNGTTIRYAVIAYPGGTAHNSSLGTSAFDQLTDVSSHEIAEAVTDPDVNYKALGWYDDRLNGEIADLTEDNPQANVRLNGYLVQEVADRNDNLLVINTTTTPPTTPPPTTVIATTTALSAGPVHYSRNGTASVVLTVRLSAASGSKAPTGSVQLLQGGKVLGTGTISVVNGVAQVSFQVTFSSYSLFTWDYYQFSASYAGNSGFGASTSNAVTVAV